MSFTVSPTAFPSSENFLALTRDPKMTASLSNAGQPAMTVRSADQRTLSGIAQFARTFFHACVLVDPADNELAAQLEGRGLAIIDRSSLAAIAWSRTLP